MDLSIDHHLRQRFFIAGLVTGITQNGVLVAFR
jgi:hypothetical protein